MKTISFQKNVSGRVGLLQPRRSKTRETTKKKTTTINQLHFLHQTLEMKLQICQQRRGAASDLTEGQNDQWQVQNAQRQGFPEFI